MERGLPDQTPAFASRRPRTTAVRLTAVVTDRQGRPVPGLAPGDFELREDGVPQTIDDAEPSAIASAPRLFAFLLDEFHVGGGGSTALVRDVLSRFVASALRPDDLTVVIRPLDSLTSIQLTRDRAAALGAMAGFDGRKDDLAPRTALEAQLIGRAPERVRADRARIVVTALGEIVAHLGQAPAGRGVVVFVSDGLVPDARRAGGRFGSLDAVVRAANRFDVPIYALAPRPEDAADGAAPPLDTGPAAMLQELAGRTGGEAVLDPGGLAAGLDRLARDLDASYLLTYRPTRADDGKYRRVEVRATRRGVQVRARPGHWSPFDEEARRAWTAHLMSSIAAPRMRMLRRSALIDSWVGVTRVAGGHARVVLTWEPSRRLARAGAASDARTILVRAATADGTPLFQGRIAPVGVAGLAADAPARASFEAPPGRVEIDLAVLGADDEVLDTDARDVDVPAPGAPAILAPQVLRTRSAREFEDLSADPAAAPTPAREFSRTERLILRVPAYDAQGAPLEVRAALLNAAGQVMRELPALAGAVSHGVTQFDVLLSPLAPGEYEIELTAGPARERVRIRVTG
jgi:VWFA-related protein